MTHDELLAKIDAYHKTCLSGGSDKDVPKSYNWSCYNLHAMARTLRAIVELHRPYEDEFGGLSCSCETCWARDEMPIEYPCPTIEAIEKELE